MERREGLARFPHPAAGAEEGRGRAMRDGDARTHFQQFPPNPSCWPLCQRPLLTSSPSPALITLNHRFTRNPLSNTTS